MSWGWSKGGPIRMRLVQSLKARARLAWKGPRPLRKERKVYVSRVGC